VVALEQRDQADELDQLAGRPKEFGAEANGLNEEVDPLVAEAREKNLAPVRCAGTAPSTSSRDKRLLGPSETAK
jgi:hypothetical protein